MKRLKIIIPSVVAGIVIATAMPAGAVKRGESTETEAATFAFVSHIKQKRPTGGTLTSCTLIRRRPDTFHCTLEVLGGLPASNPPVLFKAEGTVVLGHDAKAARVSWIREGCNTKA
jgi:hypothetical protein